MLKIKLTIYLITIISVASSQTCFDAYDSLFENGNDTLNYKEFHLLEIEFLNNLNGCTAPDFSVTTINENDIILSELKGKIVVLNFWFTTCLPCLKEIPHLNLLTNEFDNDEVIFIGLSRDTPEKLNAFFKRFGPFEYEIIPESHEIATTYKVIGWPQSMVIDKQGKVYKSWAGAHEKPENLAKEIKIAIENCINSN